MNILIIQKLTLTGSSEKTMQGSSYPYSLRDFAIPNKGPIRSSCAFVKVKACARIYHESMHVHRAWKIGTPSILAICLLSYMSKYVC